MKRILFAIASAFFVAVLSFIIAVPIMNDNFAKKTASDILSVPLPEKQHILRAYLLRENWSAMETECSILEQS